MYRNILMVLGFLVFSSCSQSVPEKKLETVVKLPVKTHERNANYSENAVNTLKVPTVNAPVVNEVTMESSSEFIPEHIKRSRIEVVKHY